MVKHGPTCFECGKLAKHFHHIVPRCRGGSRTIGLCISCHSKVHGLDRMAISQLTKDGIARAQAAGKHCGRPTIPKRKLNKILELSLDSLPVSLIAKKTRLSVNTVKKYLKEYENIQSKKN